MYKNSGADVYNGVSHIYEYLSLYPISKSFQNHFKITSLFLEIINI